MRFQMLCFGIFLITALMMLDDVATKSLSQPSDTQQLANNIRTRRGTEDKDLALLIAELIQQGKHESAYLIYSKESQSSGTNQKDLVQRIVSIIFEKNDESKLVNFIMFVLDDIDQFNLWGNSLNKIMEANTKDNDLRRISTTWYIGRAARRITIFNSFLSDEDFKSPDLRSLELLADKMSKEIIDRSKLALPELVKSIESGNTGPVISAATQYPMLFDSIFKEFISTVADVNNTNSEKNLVERFRKVFDLIPDIPSLTTSIDALVNLNEALKNLKPNFISTSEGVMLAYSIKKMEAKIENSNELSLNYKRKFSELKNSIPLGIQKLVDDPYVFIYKTDEKRKFMSSFMWENQVTLHYSDKTNERSLWVLEPVNNADQFRIKNQGSGEYLYADDEKSLKEFPNKRPVYTGKLENGSDVINNDSLGDRLVWVVAPVVGTNANRFNIMNLHSKEFLVSQDVSTVDPWDRDEGNSIYTWKDKVDPPASAKDWIISLRGPPKSQQKMRLVCFYENWTRQKEGDDRFTPDNIDPSKCTHLIYNRARIDTYGNTIKINNDDNEEDEIIDTLKKKNSKLKVMISIGKEVGGDYYSHLNSQPEEMKTLVDSLVNFLERNKFDGIHFELEYLFTGDQWNGATSLLKALREELKNNYLISAKVHVKFDSKRFGDSDIQRISSFNEVLDFMGLPAFNFHGPWDQQIMTIMPYYDDFRTSDIDAEYAVNEIIKHGFSPSKLILDIPFHGKTWKQSTRNSDKKPDNNIKDEGVRNIESSEQPKIPYYEICKLVKNGKWEKYQEPLKNPHAFSPSLSDQRSWVAYDDPDMIVFKAYYILTKGLGGAYVNIMQDDFTNSCGSGVNPLLTAVAKTLGKDEAFI